METPQQKQSRHLKVLKYGDILLLGSTDTCQGFISGSESMEPQVRLEELPPGGKFPLNVQDCRFEVRQRFESVELKAFNMELNRLGVTERQLDQLLKSKGSDEAVGGEDLANPNELSGSKSSRFRESVAEAALSHVDEEDIAWLARQRRAMRRERTNNLEEFKRSIGDTVLYGDTIQLYHISSGAFIAVKKSAATMERGNLQVCLESDCSDHGWFEVKSGYRTRHDGDRVYYGEVVSLRSIPFHKMGISVGQTNITEYSMLPLNYVSSLATPRAGPGQSISSTQVPITREVAAGPTSGRFKLVPHALHDSLLGSSAKVLAGCSVISLNLKSEDKLLMVDRGVVQFGSTQPTYFDGMTEEEKGVPGHSLWRLEPTKVEWSGQPLTAGTSCRLKHVMTNMYLSAKEALAGPPARALLLTTNQSDPNTVWRLHNSVAGSDPSGGVTPAALPRTTHVFLQHETGMWLTSGPSIESQRQGHQALSATSLASDGLWAALAGQNVDGNILGLEVAPAQLERQALKMASIVTVVLDFLHSLKTRCHPIRLEPWSEKPLEQIHQAVMASGAPAVFAQCWPRVKGTLDNVIELTTDVTSYGNSENDLLVNSYQNLAMEMRLVDAIIEALQVLNIQSLYGASGQQYVGLYCHGRDIVKFGYMCNTYLQKVVHDSPVLQNYVAPRIPLLQQHLGGPVRAADTLASIYDGNMHQIQVLDVSILQSFIDLIITTGRRPHYLNFLARVCGIEDRPVPRNQNILSSLIRDNAAGVGVKACWDTKGCWVITDGQTQVDCAQYAQIRHDWRTPEISMWPPISDTTDKQYDLFVYYIHLLQLYAALCYGRSELSKKNLLEMDTSESLGLDFNSLLRGVNSPELPNVLRAAFVQLLEVMYINSEPFRALELPYKIQLMQGPKTSSLTMQDAEGSSSDVVHRQATELSEACLRFLEDLKRASREKVTVGRIALALRVVETVDLLFQLGVINLEEPLAGRMLSALLRLGSHFDIQAEDDEQRFVNQPGNDLVMAIKTKILEILNLVLDLQMDQQVAQIFDDFKATHRNLQFGSDPERPLRTAWADSNAPELPGAVNKRAEDYDNTPLIQSKQPEDSGDNPIAVLQKRISVTGPRKKEPPQTPLGKAAQKLRMAKPHGIELLAFDCFDPDKPDGPIMCLMELMRYDDVELKGKAIQLVERLLSKQRRLARLLMDTQVVADPTIIRIYHRIQALVKVIEVNIKWVAALDESAKEAAIARCKEAISEMTDMLIPWQTLQIDDALGKDEVIRVTREDVAILQTVMRDIDVHRVVNTILKLPLRCKKTVSEDGMPEAEEQGRRELFGLCYLFLRRFAASREPRGKEIRNIGNQNTLFSCIGLYMTHVGIKNLNVADTLVAIGSGNHSLAEKVPASLVAEMVSIIVRYGGKERTRWLRFLQAVVTVDGRPIPRNQGLVLTLIAEHEEAVCQLFKDDAGKAARLELMRSNDHIVNTEQGEEARGSRLEYHSTSVQLIADCCTGGEPTLLVKAVGFLSLGEVLECICARWDNSVAIDPSTGRFVKAAYCSFLRHVYLLPNAENTRAAIVNHTDLIWPSEEYFRSALTEPEETLRASGPRCLMHTIMDEIDAALQEPSDALTKSFSATHFAIHHLLGVISVYFEEHFVSFYANVPSFIHSAYDTTMQSLADKLTEFQAYLMSLPAEQQDFAVDWNRALKKVGKAAKGMAMAVSENKADGIIWATQAVMKHRSLRMSMSMDAATTLDNQTIITPSKHQETQVVWKKFTQDISRELGVEVDFDKYEAVEVKVIDGRKVQYVSLWKMARLLVAPAGTTVKNAVPAWLYTSMFRCLVGYLTSQRKRLLVEWEEEMLVKLLRALRAAVYLDDGVLEPHSLKDNWDRAVSHQPIKRSSPEKLAWVQSKYNSLGLTRLAVEYMASPTPSVQVEALQILTVLLYGGHTEVQDTAHFILDTDVGISQAWFTNISNIMGNYIEHHTAKRALTEDQMAKLHSSAGRGGAGGSAAPKGRVSRAMMVSRMDMQPPQETDEDDGPEAQEESDAGPSMRLNVSGDPDRFCRETLSMLQLMCEGLHHKNQVLMRKQPNNVINVNLTHKAVDVLNLLHVKMTSLPPVVPGSEYEAQVDRYEEELQLGMVAVFKLLNEMLQGPCRSNQLGMLVGSPLLLLSNQVLASTLYRPAHIDLRDLKLQSALKCNLLALLSSLLEGNRPEDEEIPSRMLDILALQLLDRQVLNLLQIMRNCEGDEDYYCSKADTRLVLDTVTRELTSFFALLGKLSVVVDESRSWQSVNATKDTESIFKAIVGPGAETFQHNHLGSVEVMWKGAVEKVFFPLTDECRQRNQDHQWTSRALTEVQSLPPEFRSNTLQKGIELCRVLRTIEEDIEADAQLVKNAPFVHWVAKQDKSSNKLAFYISCVTIFALLILLPEAPAIPVYNSYDITGIAMAPGDLLQGWKYYFVKTLVGLEVVCSFFVMAAHLCGTARRWWVQTWDEPEIQELLVHRATRWTARVMQIDRVSGLISAAVSNGPKVAPGVAVKQSGESCTSPMPSNLSILTGRPSFVAGSESASLAPPPELVEIQIHLVVKVAELVLYLATSFKFWFTLGQIIFAMLTFTNEFFVVYQLTIFFVEFESGIMLVGALQVAGSSLLRTGAMGIIIILIYAVVGYIFFSQPSGVETEMNSWAGDSPPCSSFYQCVGGHMIAGMMGDLSPMYTNDHGELWKYVPIMIQHNEWLQVRSFFVISFFIIWGFILSNIFTGQIVDAFGSIRDDKRTMDDDTSSRCLVCSIDRFVLDQHSKGGGFEHHVNEEHCPLKYVYYLHFLRKTPRDEYRGVDTFVAECLSGPEPHAWLPIGRALAVEQRGLSREAEDRERARLEGEQLAATVKAVEKMVSEMRSSMDARLERIERDLIHGDVMPDSALPSSALLSFSASQQRIAAAADNGDSTAETQAPQ